MLKTQGNLNSKNIYKIKGLQQAVILWAALMLSACSGAKPEQEVTGTGGTLVKYSSSQVLIHLTQDERSALARYDEREFPGAVPSSALNAVCQALTASGYESLNTEADTGLVEAGRSEVLVPKSRQLLRGLLATKIGVLPAKPDHQYTAALVSIRPAGHAGVLIRVRLKNTVWDSKGDAKTMTVVAREAYDSLFSRIQDALATPENASRR